MNTNEHDVIIVGGGAAGLSAALVLSRARRRVVVVDAGAPRNAPAAQMQGFLSRDGMPPSELLAAGRAEVVAYGAEIVTATVQQLLAADSTDAPAFVARLADGTTLHGRRVLVTTGLSDELPDIPGLRDRWARDVLHCPYCHGYEVRDQRLGVVWNGPMTPAYAQIVRQWSHDVVLLAPPTTLTDQQRTELLARAIGIVESPVTGVEVCDDRLTGVTLADGTTLRRDALFVPPRFTPHSDLLVQLGCDLDDDGWVITAAHGASPWPASGWPATSATREPRSSPPPARDPRPPSPSMPTSSTRTSAWPSATSVSTPGPNRPHHTESGTTPDQTRRRTPCPNPRAPPRRSSRVRPRAPHPSAWGRRASTRSP